MAITVTWDDGVSPATQFTVPADVLASIDQFRATVMSISGGQMMPTYATVKDMIIGFFITGIVMPALERFPTAGIEAAQANVVAAQLALMMAKAAAIPGFEG